jgi:hypothetical protein
MRKLDNYGVLRLTMADLRIGVSFEAATVADVSGHRAEIRAARCVCLTSAEGEQRIIGGRAECLRLDTHKETDARSAMTLAQIVEELNAASGPNVQYRVRATIATVDRMLARVEEYCDDVD